MNAAAAAALFGPYEFALTQEEARAAAARAGLRAAFAGGLLRRQIAPLALFALFVTFAAILTFSGLVSRRHGETALLLAAIAYMALRMATHWRLRRTRRSVLVALRPGEPVVATIGEAGLSLAGALTTPRWDFVKCLEAEAAGDLVYLWPRIGAPAVIPARSLAPGQSLGQLLAFLRERLARSGANRR